MMKASKLFVWLKMKTAGRADHRFSSPITFSFTPAKAWMTSAQAGDSTLIAARMSLLSTPAAVANVAIGPAAASEATVRPMSSSDGRPRLWNFCTGQLRARAMRSSSGNGFVGRGLPTLIINGTSSLPSA